MSARVVAFTPGVDRGLEWRRVLLYASEQGYEIVALAVGERAWAGAVAMVAVGEADRVITTARSGHTTGPVPVEVAGSGRTVLRQQSRTRLLREIAELVDSPLSIEEVVRVLRDREGRR